MGEAVSFTCNGTGVTVDANTDETLLYALRERLGVLSPKDGCAPQGQCGCCTVLVDGEPRVACVTPLTRVAGRTVTTLEGLPPEARDRAAEAFTASGGSQCGFCTPGIIMRFAGTRTRAVDRALAAHLCRCTGWKTVREAVELENPPPLSRDLAAAARRAEIEGGTAQIVGAGVPLGCAPFADDTAPRGALVAVPLPPASPADSYEAAGLRWVVGESLFEARAAAGKTQGRRTTTGTRPPLLGEMPVCPPGGVALATSWVEPAYLEPDASWCEPGGEPASPLANGGAFGGKVASAAPPAARELADRFGRAVRVVYSREDVVRLGPKRPPVAAVAWLDGDVVHIDGVVAAGAGPVPVLDGVHARWREVAIPGPPVSWSLRAAGLAEQAMLAAAVRGHNPARVSVEGGRVKRVEVEVSAGNPLDEIVLRSYAIGAAHMAVSWVTSEQLAVDERTGEVHDLTIRSFGVLRAVDTPEIEVAIVDDGGAPRRVSDDVFIAVAAATWNALGNPTTLPAS